MLFIECCKQSQKKKPSIFSEKFQNKQPTNRLFQSEFRNNLHYKHIYIYSEQSDKRADGCWKEVKGKSIPAVLSHGPNNSRLSTQIFMYSLP